MTKLHNYSAQTIQRKITPQTFAPIYHRDDRRGRQSLFSLCMDVHKTKTDSPSSPACTPLGQLFDD
jgi:hypothetical protein